MNKLDQLMANKPFKLAFVFSFFICFLGVMSGFERAIVSVLVVAFGMLVGYQGAMQFRRWRGDFKP